MRGIDVGGKSFAAIALRIPTWQALVYRVSYGVMVW